MSVKRGSTAYSRLIFTFHRSQGNLVAVALCLTLSRLPSVVYIPNVVTHNTTVVVAVSWCWFIARLLCGQCRYCSVRSVQCYVFRPVRNTIILMELTETIGNWCAKPNSVIKLINIKFALIYLTISSTIGVYPLSRSSRQPTLQETYVMPILNKPVVFQPHKSFSVNVFLIYAGCVPKVWKLIKNNYISVISVITDLNLALRILSYFPHKS